MQEWYYVKGGQQSGPVSLEELRTLANNGTLLPGDLVWNSSMQDWTVASTVSGIFSSMSPSPNSDSPHLPTPNPQATASPIWTEIRPGSDPIQIGSCIERAFKLTVRHIGQLLLIILILVAISITASSIMTALDKALGLPGAFSFAQTELLSHMPPGATISVQQNQASILNLIITNLISTFLGLGIIRIGLNIVDSKAFTIAQLFGGGPYLLRAILAALLWTAVLACAVGIVVAPAFFLSSVMSHAPFIATCIVAGIVLFVGLIYLSLRFGFYSVAIVDRNASVIEAFQYSSRITTHNRLLLFLLMLLGILIVLAGLIAFCVGVLFAYPLVCIAWVVAYRWMQYGAQVVQEPMGPSGL